MWLSFSSVFGRDKIMQKRESNGDEIVLHFFGGKKWVTSKKKKKIVELGVQIEK